jgi:hypothetical protein
VIGAAAEVANLPVTASRTQIDDEFGGVALYLRDGGRVRRGAMRLALGEATARAYVTQNLS